MKAFFLQRSLVFAWSAVCLIAMGSMDGAAVAQAAQSVPSHGQVPATSDGNGVHDYIPCLLSADELARLHGVNPGDASLIHLTGSQATAAAQEILATVSDLVAAKQLNSEALKTFKEQITGTSLQSFDAAQLKTKVEEVTRQVLDAEEKAKRLSQADRPAIGNKINGVAQRVIENKFEPPTDVACSMSVLTYKEANDIFGLRVAQQYIAIQIVVRNLNGEEEYLLHDAGLAVDTDPAGTAFRQFDSSRDRLLVRAVALRNQATDPRNRTVRIMEGVGLIAASAVGFASRDYSYGLAVFNSLIPAGKSIFPDYTIEQLNRLSDMAFTASGQSRTVVGKNGAAMFVVFIPEEPLEQAWWIRERKKSSKISKTPEHAESSTDSKNKKPSETPAAVSGNSAPITPSVEAEATTMSSNAKDLTDVEERKPVAYKNWSPNTLLAFRQQTFAMVAGVHIAAIDDLKPVFTGEACPKTTTGELALSGATEPTFVCPVTGKNLGKVVSVILREANESEEIRTAKGSIQPVAGDPTQAKITFQLADLKNLPKTDYKMYWVDTTKVENATDFVEHIPRASLTAADPATLKLADVANHGLKLTGASLDLATGVQVEGVDDPRVTEVLTRSDITPTSLTATFGKASKLVAGRYKVVLLQGEPPIENAKTMTLVVTP